MAKTALARSIALALPKVRLMSPCRGRATLASKASRLSSVNTPIPRLFGTKSSGPKTLGQIIVDVVGAQILLQAGNGGPLADPDELDVRDGREILEHFGRHAIAKAGVMRAAREDPGGAGRLEVGFAFPNRAGDRKFRQRWMADRRDLVHEQAEPGAEIDQAGVERRPCGRVEDESHRILLAADRQRVNLERRPGRGDRRADLEHVRAEHLMAIWREVVGVVLHERGPARQSLAHDLHRAHERRRLPVALGAEAVTVSHQALRPQSGKLPKPMQVLESGGE